VLPFLNQFATEFRSACALLDVAYAESASMDEASMDDDGINRDRYSKARESPQPGPAVMRAGNHLAIVCLFFGVAFAAFVSGSLEQRIGNLFSLGLMPAVGFYAGGHVLGQLLVFGVKLCDMIMARCSRYAVHLANGLLNRAGTHVSNRVTGGVRTELNARGPNGNEFRT
jgi:hypothetical protein